MEYNKSNYLCLLCGITFKTFLDGMNHLYRHGLTCQVCKHPIRCSHHFDDDEHLRHEIQALLDSDLRLKFEFLNSQCYFNALKQGKYKELRNMILHHKMKSI